jgi:putative transcriptional regulator
MAPKEEASEPTIVHNRLAVLRAERNVSRKELAEAVGVNSQTIGYIERGDYNPSLEVALKISYCFGLPMEMIFSLEPFRPLSEEIARFERRVS